MSPLPPSAPCQLVETMDLPSGRKRTEKAGPECLTVVRETASWAGDGLTSAPSKLTASRPAGRSMGSPSGNSGCGAESPTRAEVEQVPGSTVAERPAHLLAG